MKETLWLYRMPCSGVSNMAEVMGTMSHADLSALSIADLTHMIHILDTEHPWEVHSVSSGHSEAITCLEWDQSGEAMRAEDAAFLGRSSVLSPEPGNSPPSLGVQSGEGAPSSLPAYQKGPHTSLLSQGPDSCLLMPTGRSNVGAWLTTWPTAGRAQWGARWRGTPSWPCPGCTMG